MFLTNGFGRKRYASIIRLRYISYSLSPKSGVAAFIVPNPWLLSRCWALCNTIVTISQEQRTQMN